MEDSGSKEKVEKVKKEMMVVIPEHVKKQMEEIGEEDPEALAEFEKIIQGFVSGEIDPEEVGEPVSLKELEKQLLCMKCDSDNVQWRDVGDEAMFSCFDCNFECWMKMEDYEKAVNENPESVIDGK